MKKSKLNYLAIVAIAGAVFTSCNNGNTEKKTEKTANSETVKKGEKTHYVTPEDFGVSSLAYCVSETDFNIKRSLERQPEINKWSHKHEKSDVKSQQVIRENQDAYYSSAVVDVTNGATISVPDYPYYSIIQIIDMQNYSIGTVYPGQSIHITLDDLSYGHYVYLNARTKPAETKNPDLNKVWEQQKKLKIEATSAIPYVSPDIVIPPEKLLEIRTALIEDVKKGKVHSFTDMMGKKDEVNPQDHLYATAFGWGGLPVHDAAYIPLRIELDSTNKGSVTIATPPIKFEKNGFWSITVYNKEGWLAYDKAAIFNKDVVKNEDGTSTIRFNCEGMDNNLQAPEGFAAVLRMYIPNSKEEINAYIDNALKNYVIKPCKK